MKSIAVLMIAFILASPSLVSFGAEEKKVIEKIPTHYQMGVEHLKQEDFDLAIENFQKALSDERSATGQARIYNLIGIAYMQQDTSPQSAIGSFQQAVELDPGFAEAYFNIASVYASKENDPVKASQYFQKTIDVDPNYTRAYFGLGWFSLVQKQDASKALEFFAKTIAANPDFAEAYYGQGMAYVQLQKPHMALGAVSRLRALQRNDLAATLEEIITQVSPPRSEGGELEEAAPLKTPFTPTKANN